MPNYTTTPSGRLLDLDATPDHRTYATLTHLSLLVLHIGVPPPLVALVMWLIKKNHSPFLDDHGKEAVNFQISIVIYGFISAVLSLFLIGIPMLIAVYLLAVINCIRAAVAANRGEMFRYPVTIRLIV